jgi:Tol biopolymer transport system component
MLPDSQVQRAIQRVLDRMSLDVAPGEELPQSIRRRVRRRLIVKGTMGAITLSMGAAALIFLLAWVNVPPSTQQPAAVARSLSHQLLYVDMTSLGGPSSIYKIDNAGAAPTLLIKNLSDVAGLSWAPDGTKFAFSASDHSGYHIYIANADGSSVTQLTTGDSVDTAPAWSPSGDAIAFQSNRDDARAGQIGVDIVNDIFVMNSDGTGLQNITQDAYDDTGPSWSPDGTEIAFASNLSGTYGLYTVQIGGSKSQLLVDTTSNESQPAWDPQGGRIAYVSSSGRATSAIWIVDLSTDKAQALTSATESADSPTWSSDGGRIAFVHTGSLDQHSELPSTNIYSVSADGSSVQSMTDTNDGFQRDPAW